MKKFFVALCVMFLVIVGGSAFAGPGDVWLTPTSVTVNPNEAFNLDVYLDTGSQSLGAYGFDIIYDYSLVAVDTSMGSISGVTPGADGFLSAVNADPGVLTVAGFDVTGTGPSSDLHLLTISFLALSGVGVSTIDLNVNSLIDTSYTTIGSPTGYGATVSVEQPVPVPPSVLLLGSGLVGLAGFRKKFRKR